MIDWSKIHAEEIAPALAKFASPPPPIVLGILLIVFLVGLALVIWAPAKFKAVGFLLICAMLFIAYMTAGNYYRAKNRLARYEYGALTEKYSKKSTRKDSRGQILPVTTYFIRMDVSEARDLGSRGATGALPAHIGKQERIVDEALYNKLNRGDSIYIVILPTAKDAAHFAVRKNGEVVR